MKYRYVLISDGAKSSCRLIHRLILRRTKSLTVRILCAFLIILTVVSLTTIGYFRKYRAHLHSLLREYNDEDQPICEYVFRGNLSWMDYWVLNSFRLTENGGYGNLTNYHTCEEFKLIHRQTVKCSEEEKEFPLAFSLAVHENIRPVSRLLRLIYRPNNLYCIHVDSKSPQVFYDEVMALANCFGGNVIVVNRSESVVVRWGYYSILEVFLLCADKLMRSDQVKWKYILNVSGQELPLRTNWELVAALKAINGWNIVDNSGSKDNHERWPNWNFSFPIHWIKGSFYMALSRDFVNFYQTNSKAREILSVMKAERHLMKHPDELYFPTLVYNPSLGAPGACEEFYLSGGSDPRATYVGRYVNWLFRRCKHGKSRHGVCLIGLYLSQFIPTRMEFFANKFREEFQPIAYDCTEHYVMQKILREMRTKQLDPNFNVTFYSQLYCSQYHFN
ncbi:unnamed protein product [Trichobilharzia szidati]|nr:unnamed protein product [Trichobilharzia szidati]